MADSVFAFDEVAGDRFEWLRACSKGVQFSKGIGDKRSRLFHGGLETEDCWPGGLVACGVFACGLAEFFGALSYIQDIVDDLEGESCLFAKGT